MDFTKYTNLPESLTPAETNSLFQELLALEQHHTSEYAISLAQAMDEVADRHWHTYTLLDDATRKAVDSWVVRNWDRSSLKKARALISVVAKLGLTNSAEMLRHERYLDTPSAVKKEIDDALGEFDSTVDDPYSGVSKRFQ